MTKARKSNIKNTKKENKLFDDIPANTEDDNGGADAEGPGMEEDKSEEEDGNAQIKDEEED